jgi:hypothetical protein
MKKHLENLRAGKTFDSFFFGCRFGPNAGMPE